MRSQKQVHATMDEARRVVSNIAKLPTFLANPDPHQWTIRA